VTAKDYGECESCYRAEDIAEAVAAERERCAKVALRWTEAEGYACDAAEFIAAAIREGT
jgi:hypothetical protein